MNDQDERLIDLLVDGDLDPDRRRELLLRLEAEPDGWRRCALAFLEAQAFRETLGGLARAAVPEPPAPAIVPTRSTTFRPLLRRAAVAAGLLAAFALGRFTDGGRPAAPVPIPSPPIVQHVEPAPEPPSKVGTASVGGTRVPILAGDGLDERWLLDQPPPVPDYVRHRWERAGYEVEQNRRLISVSLGDGRRVALPLDEVEVHYVGRPVY